MKHYTVGVVGHFSKGIAADGQTVKTRITYDALVEKYGKDSIIICDTYKWKKHPLKLLVRCIKVAISTKNIIIMPAHNGLRIFVPLFYILKPLFSYDIHYLVIGAWLAKTLSKSRILTKMIKSFKGVYIETSTSKRSLNNIGLENVYLIPNYKYFTLTKDAFNKHRVVNPLKLCTFSRVNEKKGIEDAVNAVKSINDKYGTEIFTLDIYGQVDPGFSEKFKSLIENSPNSINYKGIIDFSETTSVLEKYYMLLFPTHYYYTEGVPGTIIDAYSAGLPVIAAKWQSYDDTIIENVTGFGYQMEDRNGLEHKLEFIINNSSIESMRKNCMEYVEIYRPNKALKPLFDMISK